MIRLNHWVIAALVVPATAVMAIGSLESWRQDEADFMEIMRILGKPRVPERYRDNGWWGVRVSQFNWKTCSDPSDPSSVESLVVSPDPMVLPGNVSVSVHATLKVPLKSPITLDLHVQKKVVFWITIPCIDSFGSCNYVDVCTLLPLIQCPPVFQKYGIPCECPIKEGVYALPLSPFYIDDSMFPSILTSGDYRVTARLSEGKLNIGCLYLEFSIA